jgi:hypothetical protein
LPGLEPGIQNAALVINISGSSVELEEGEPRRHAGARSASRFERFDSGEAASWIPAHRVTARGHAFAGMTLSRWVGSSPWPTSV